MISRMTTISVPMPMYISFSFRAVLPCSRPPPTYPVPQWTNGSDAIAYRALGLSSSFSSGGELLLDALGGDFGERLGDGARRLLAVLDGVDHGLHVLV